MEELHRQSTDDALKKIQPRKHGELTLLNRLSIEEPNPESYLYFDFTWRHKVLAYSIPSRLPAAFGLYFEHFDFPSANHDAINKFVG